MGGGKLPPRQKMIGMMYLVLTALLAMNVSKDILNAFIVVNEGLEHTNHNFNEKTTGTLTSLEEYVKKTPGDVKAKQLSDKAKEVKKTSDELIEYINELKKELIMHTDKKTKEAADTLITKMRSIDAKDNYDVPTHLLIGDEPGKPKDGPFTANELKGKIDACREKYVKLLGEAEAQKLILPEGRKLLEKSVKDGLRTDQTAMENGVKVGWADLNFYHLPLAAVITNLTKIQSDINNAEADVINFFKNQIGATDVKISGFQAEVIAKSSYVLSGDKYEAEVLLVAQSSSTKPRIFIGDTSSLKKGTAGAKALEVINGVGKYELAAGGEGLQKWGGIIEIDKPDGTIDRYPFSAEYMVAKPAAAVSPDKMNVFYIGVDNPVTISAAGVAPEQLQPALSGQGSISGSKGKYMVKVTGGTEVSINVNAKFGTGSKSMGTSKFRVKRLPDPYAFVLNKRGDISLKKGELAAAGGIIAKFENFDFDLPVTVSSYTISANVKGVLKEANVVGNKYDANASNVISAVGPGSKVYIENIKARLPDGSSRNLPSINIKING